MPDSKGCEELSKLARPEQEGLRLYNYWRSEYWQQMQPRETTKAIISAGTVCCLAFEGV